MRTTTTDESTPRSRRALLAGALGGLGAWAAAALSTPAEAEAAYGDPILAGKLTTAGGRGTTLRTSTPGPALKVDQNGRGPAVDGTSENGSGLVGRSRAPEEDGVRGLAVRGSGIYGRTLSGRFQHGGVKGENPTHGSTGLLARAWTGVWGHGFVGVEGYSHTVYSGYAGVFGGRTRVYYLELPEIVASKAGTPPRRSAYLFVRDNGRGKSQLCVRFRTGAVQVLAREP